MSVIDATIIRRNVTGQDVVSSSKMTREELISLISDETLAAITIHLRHPEAGIEIEERRGFVTVSRRGIKLGTAYIRGDNKTRYYLVLVRGGTRRCDSKLDMIKFMVEREQGRPKN
jgi:hypothetical protein